MLNQSDHSGADGHPLQVGDTVFFKYGVEMTGTVTALLACGNVEVSDGNGPSVVIPAYVAERQ